MNKTNARCPHCGVSLTIERATERRVVPCPSCNQQIRIPEDIETNPQTSPGIKQMTSAPQTDAQPVLGKYSSIPLPVFLGVAGCFVLVLFYISWNRQAPTGSLPVADSYSVPNRLSEQIPVDVIKDELNELEMTRVKLQREQAELTDKINTIETQIRATLDLSPSEVETFKRLTDGGVQ